jgi:hypothetical protein
MALAILQLEDTDSTRYRFRVNIGTNRFYRYAIAPSAAKQSNGLVQLQDTKFTSPLIGPIPEASLGKTVFDVPRDRFDRKNNQIQITSFRTKNLEGPALSDVLPVIARLEESGVKRQLHSSAFSEDFDASLNGTNRDWSMERAMEKTPIETIPFTYREEPPVSSAMFIEPI